jgi:hypothetical protein
MPNHQINLPVRLTAAHRRVVLKYFEASNRLSAAEWKLVLEAFDLLARAMIVTGRRRLSFRQFYEQQIELRYADAFLEDLVATDASETSGETLQRQTAGQIIADLEQAGLYHEDLPNSELLAAFCLYWWTSFARGYRFEAVILHQLRTAGIEFVAHDLRVRAERLAPYDLIVNRRLGDIKHTTYFLYTARALPLKCDFYITRLYITRQRCYQIIVILTEPTWHDLNGPVASATLETAADIFPAPVQILFEGQPLVVVTFGLWQKLVKQRQAQEL